MKDGPKALKWFSTMMATLGIFVITIVIFFKFSVRNESYTFAQAWERGLVQSFLIINVALVVIAFALIKRQRWARWAALLWGAALGANAIGSEFWHSGSVSGYAIFEGLLIAGAWTWFARRELFSPEVAALFRRTSG